MGQEKLETRNNLGEDMKIYTVEVTEIHKTRYIVEASDENEARKIVEKGEQIIDCDEDENPEIERIEVRDYNLKEFID